MNYDRRSGFQWKVTASDIAEPVTTRISPEITCDEIPWSDDQRGRNIWDRWAIVEEGGQPVGLFTVQSLPEHEATGDPPLMNLVK